MTATYGGDTYNAGSTSSVVTQTVNADDFTLSSSPSSVTVAGRAIGDINTYGYAPRLVYQFDQLLVQRAARPCGLALSNLPRSLRIPAQ